MPNFCLSCRFGWVLSFSLSFSLTGFNLRCKGGLCSPQATCGPPGSLCTSSFDLGPVLHGVLHISQVLVSFLGAPLMPCEAEVADQIQTPHPGACCIRTSSRHAVRPFACAPACQPLFNLDIVLVWSDCTASAACCAPTGPSMHACRWLLLLGV